MRGHERCRGRILALPVIVLCALALSLAIGCSSQGASSSDAPQLTPEEMIEQKDAWADEVVRNALDELADEGAIDKPDRTAELLEEAFEFEKTEDGYGIAFKDAKIGAELSGAYVLPEGKAIICRMNRGPIDEAPFFVVCPEYADGGWVNEDVGEDVPLFYPESLDGQFGGDDLKGILAGVPADSFADSFDDCDYLILYNGAVSHVSKEYYVGGIDRTSITTLVLIVDVKEGKVVHIENLGTDTPGSTVQMGGQRGKMLWDEVAVYLHDLLANRP